MLELGNFTLPPQLLEHHSDLLTTSPVTPLDSPLTPQPEEEEEGGEKEAGGEWEEVGGDEEKAGLLRYNSLSLSTLQVNTSLPTILEGDTDSGSSGGQEEGEDEGGCVVEGGGNKKDGGYLPIQGENLSQESASPSDPGSSQTLSLDLPAIAPTADQGEELLLPAYSEVPQAGEEPQEPAGGQERVCCCCGRVPRCMRVLVVVACSISMLLLLSVLLGVPLLFVLGHF